MSALRTSLEEYIAMRRAAGFALRDTATALNGFVAFAEHQGSEIISTQLALRWAQQPANAQSAWRATRLDMVRLFAQYLSAQEPRTEIPPTGLIPRGYRRRQPYLYSDEEVDRLVQAARELPSPTGLRACTYATFLGLLAVTGMRMGEAVNLDLEDVDPQHGLLTLRHTKLGRERHVPIHPTTHKALLDCQKYRHRIYPRANTSSFFLAEHGKRLKKETVRDTFVKLSRQIGLRGPCQSHGPRLQDLRHRFAVRTMLNWYRTGVDVEAQLPKLSTYLGHVNVRSTYWYLTAVPEASPNTIESYSTAFKLLLPFAHKQLKKAPAKLLLEDLDAPFICRFLDQLESDRGNSARTRNARLAAIQSFFKYVSFREPRHSALIQRVLDIPTKRWEKKPVDFLKRHHSDALLQAPDLSTWLGRRDRALMALMVQTGLRVSETIGLRFKDVELGGPAYVRCTGKGRKQRLTPIDPPLAAILRDWAKECNAGPDQPLFANSRDRSRHLSRDAVEYLLKKHTKVAQEQCPSLAGKRVTPHVLRHSCAMNLLQSGVDHTTIALWLGHESPDSTQCYYHADIEMKQAALDKTTPYDLPSGRYRPDDSLMSFLEGLKIMPSQVSGSPPSVGLWGS